MNKEIKAKAMIEYLQEMMDAYKEEENGFEEWLKRTENPDVKRFGQTTSARRQMDKMIACKEMVEALIGTPVNLR